jgi:hypothetical protein
LRYVLTEAGTGVAILAVELSLLSLFEPLLTDGARVLIPLAATWSQLSLYDLA